MTPAAQGAAAPLGRAGRLEGHGARGPAGDRPGDGNARQLARQRLDADPEVLRQTWRWLAHGGHGFTEVRVIKPDDGPKGMGYFDDEDAFVRECVRANRPGFQVYVGIQPRPRSKFERVNVLNEARSRFGGHNDDVRVLTATVIDIDPKRPKRQASTAEELEGAMDAGRRAADWCEREGLRRPLLMMSGNGCQLWFALPPTLLEGDDRDVLTEGLAAFEAEIRDLVADVRVGVDSIHEFGRIIKAIGTVSYKGADTPDRPHRLSVPMEGFERREDPRLLERVRRLGAEAVQVKAEAKLARERSGERSAARRGMGDGSDIAEAVERFNADHRHVIDALPLGNETCPMCGHGTCFGRFKDTGRWACHAAGHAADSGRRGVEGSGCWTGDALDLVALERGRAPDAAGRAEVLREAGYLPDRPPAGQRRREPADLVSEGAAGGSRATVLPSPAPMRLAEAFLEAFGAGWLRRWRDDWWRWTGSAYAPMSNEEITTAIYRWGDRVFVAGKDGPVPWVPTLRKVAEVVSALRSCDGVRLHDALEPPAWLGDPAEAPGPNVVPVANGLLDIETRTLRPSDPRLFVTAALPVAWPGAGASRPAEWIGFLESVFGHDAGAAYALQMLFGLLLTPDTSRQRIFWLQGRPRAGKGTVVRVLNALLEPGLSTNVTLADFARPFGLEKMPGKLAGVIPDGRLRRDDEPAVVERLLSISGEDQLSVDRKHRPAVVTKLGARLVMVANQLPHFLDDAGALASRFTVIPFRVSFEGREDLTLSQRLTTPEGLSGVLAWAVEGWHILQAEGRFPSPPSGLATLRDFRGVASPVGQFVQEECNVGPEEQAELQILFEAWRKWCDRTGNKPSTRQRFGEMLRTAVPEITVSRPRDSTPDGRERRTVEYAGVGLKLRRET